MSKKPVHLPLALIAIEQTANEEILLAILNGTGRNGLWDSNPCLGCDTFNTAGATTALFCRHAGSNRQRGNHFPTAYPPRWPVMIGRGPS